MNEATLHSLLDTPSAKLSQYCSYERCCFYKLPGTDKCIFHAEAKSPQLFENALMLLLQQEHSDFTGFVFPAIGRPITFFAGRRFSQTTSFAKAAFKGYASFEKSRFDGGVLFGGARFEGAANFSDVHFMGDAYFGSAEFLQGLNMPRAVFAGTSLFDFVEFRHGIYLRGTTFSCRGIFTNCRFTGRTMIRWPGDEDRRSPDGRVIPFGNLEISAPVFAQSADMLDLRGCTLRDSDQLTISKVRGHGSMEHILLEGTDCTKIRFYDCEWPRLRDGRRVVGDEYRLCKRDRTRRAVMAHAVRVLWRRKLGLARKLRRDAPYHLIALTYQQLAKRHREELDHPHANDFERGIFEMRRRAGRQDGGRKGWSDYLLFSLYKWISNYSGSLLRPVLCLLASLAVFAWAYWGTSYKTDVSPFFWNSFKLSAEFAYLNRSAFDFALHNNFAVDLLIAAQIITTATLATLFVFSVRRRFKHD